MTAVTSFWNFLMRRFRRDLTGWLSRLKDLGYGVVLAHPEKNLQIQSDPEYLAKLVAPLDSWDLITQISADSLTGDAGRAAYNTARFLMEKGLAQVIATDTHSVFSRAPLLSAALAKAEKIVGDKRARQMVQDIPAAILRGVEISETRRARSSQTLVACILSGLGFLSLTCPGTYRSAIWRVASGTLSTVHQ